jgi:uncharacterized protein
MEKRFLTASWNQLIMANYVVEPELLQPYLPAGTELDHWQGKCYVSLVGFLFQQTKVLGIKVPFHVNFEEVNLRFYVRHNDGGVWKRGVVFISEIVPKPAIVWVANGLFHENYRTCKMKHRNEQTPDWRYVGYQWRHQGHWNSLSVVADPVALPIPAGSEAEFITEHYWGYSKKNERHTTEYAVEHPRWNMHRVETYEIHCRFGQLYGPTFAALENRPPDSVLLAEGSTVAVGDKRELIMDNG